MADTPARLLSVVPRRTRTARVARASRRSGMMLGLVAAAALACSHHVRLTSPDTDPGARYECSGSGECRPQSSDVPSDDNPSGTTSITLPRECAGKIHQILIIDAGSSEPAVRVTCAPAEEPVDTMGEPEARLAPRER